MGVDTLLEAARCKMSPQYGICPFGDPTPPLASVVWCVFWWRLENKNDERKAFCCGSRARAHSALLSLGAHHNRWLETDAHHGA